MVGEMFWFVDTAEKLGYLFYFVLFCTKIDFLSLCIWLLERWIHRVYALAAEVVSFSENISAGPIVHRIVYFRWSAGAIGGLGCIHFPDPLIFIDP